MIEYKVIKEIALNNAHTQRTLATELDVSLGRGLDTPRSLSSPPKADVSRPRRTLGNRGGAAGAVLF